MAVYGFTVQADGNVEEVMKKMETAMHSMGATAKIEVEKAESAFAGFNERIGETFKELKGLILGGLGIAAAFAGFEFIEQSKEAFDALEESVEKVNAALESTRGIGGRTFEELNAGAKDLSSKTLFSRAQIMDGQSMLLTFTNIRKEVYDKTMPAITDFATRFKMDLPSAANLVGKALNDPLTGMTKLQRQGVVFTEAQKEQIKTLVATGQVAKAQGVILNELKTEFGGLAEAMTKTDEGKIAMAKKQWGNIKLAIGEIVSKLEVAMIPLLNMVIKLAKGIGSIFTSTSTTATVLRAILLAVAGALAIYYSYQLLVAAGTAIVTAAQWAWNAAMAANPLTWIILGIVALIAVVMYCWDKFKGFREIVGGVFGFFKQEVMTTVHVFQNFAKIVVDIFHGQFKQAFEDGKKMITDFKNDVTKGMVDAVQKGAEAAGKSDFKFGNLLKFNTGQEGPGKGFGEGKALGATTQSAINTSALAGAKGGLGEAKVINIHIDTMQKVVTTDNKQLRARGQDAVEAMLRTLNNIAYSQSSTQ
jgi:uncharacterized membrane protein